MVTTHVLDTARGEPAHGVTVILELRQASGWAPIGRGATDEKGRVANLVDGPMSPGTYRLTFDIGTGHRGTLPHSPAAQPVWVQHLPRRLIVSASMPDLTWNRYGKSRIRLVKV